MSDQLFERMFGLNEIPDRRACRVQAEVNSRVKIEDHHFALEIAGGRALIGN